jgi:hypothetical protein
MDYQHIKYLETMADQRRGPAVPPIHSHSKLVPLQLKQVYDITTNAYGSFLCFISDTLEAHYNTGTFGSASVLDATTPLTLNQHDEQTSIEAAFSAYFPVGMNIKFVYTGANETKAGTITFGSGEVNGWNTQSVYGDGSPWTYTNHWQSYECSVIKEFGNTITVPAGTLSFDVDSDSSRYSQYMAPDDQTADIEGSGSLATMGVLYGSGLPVSTTVGHIEVLFNVVLVPKFSSLHADHAISPAQSSAVADMASKLIVGKASPVQKGSIMDSAVHSKAINIDKTVDAAIGSIAPWFAFLGPEVAVPAELGLNAAGQVVKSVGNAIQKKKKKKKKNK